ncbi:BTB/POZ domain-containing protein At3g44820 [Magnolia sinica]|uniref:BTB/POZ domain-containing protein At3g44820 n=1 Tax=Magnolia sinica TaxID=86752 RepID=UPI00265ABBB1|nr:BTB/POZ domain-containing protein At3g44820 [Magnolia sinica]
MDLPTRKASSGFFRDGNNWFCNAALPSDIVVEADGVRFHLHKFPLLSKCGKIANMLEESKITYGEIFHAKLLGCPGGPDAFLVAAKFCYGVRVDLTPKNIIMVYCVANYLEMTEDYGEENLLAKSESFFHRIILRNWKDCILALQSSESVFAEADSLLIVGKSLNALSMMACTDPSLFGWPMMMYGRLQSPGGSILWNGINTGARIRSIESDWWFEDVSYFNVPLFERLVETMRARGIRSKNLAGAIMHYARKYLPGLGRWQGGQGGKTMSIASFSMTPAVVDQRILLESIEKLLPLKKGKSFCRFLLGLLRVAMILNVHRSCKDSLERRIGMQLELATLDGLLLPSYSDSDNLYDTDCVERIIRHFLSLEPSVTLFSPSSIEMEASPASGPLRKVAKLIDGYLAEIAPDVNLKPEKMRSLAKALPESSRPFDDGLYRALDIYLKAHPWLSGNEKEQLCTVFNCQKLSIDACAHASQNERLPLRVILQVLFFEQLHLRTAVAGYLHVFDSESATTAAAAAAAASANDITSQILQRDGWVTVVRENQVLRVDMEKMRSRVSELEQEFTSIKHEMKRMATKSSGSFISPRLVSGRIGCNLLPRSNSGRSDIIESVSPSPRQSMERGHPPQHSRHRNGSSLP